MTKSFLLEPLQTAPPPWAAASRARVRSRARAPHPHIAHGLSRVRPEDRALAGTSVRLTEGQGYCQAGQVRLPASHRRGHRTETPATGSWACSRAPTASPASLQQPCLVPSPAPGPSPQHGRDRGPLSSPESRDVLTRTVTQQLIRGCQGIGDLLKASCLKPVL